MTRIRHARRLLVFALCAAALLCALCVTAAADAAGYALQDNGNNSYTVTRPAECAQLAQTVTLRPYSISALEGVHYTYASQAVAFAAGETSKTVTLAIEEASILTVAPVFRCVADGTFLRYGVEAVDEGGVRLASVVREINYSACIINSRVLHSGITDLMYISGSSFASAYSATGGYVDVSGLGSTYTKITDDGYGQGRFMLSLGNLYALIPKDYLAATDAKVYAAVGFTMKEDDDGYQYIQIVADSTSSYDGNDPLGDVDDPSVSLYKACFELSAVNNSPSAITTDSLQFFPHRYDHATRDAGNQTSSWTEFPSEHAKLFAQKFENSSLRAANTGALVLSPTVDDLYVRFDAAGKDDDDWYVKNLFARLAVCDSTGPMVAGAVVSRGPYTVGSTVSISVSFTEIVTTGNADLVTSWGIFHPQPRDAITNVITYSGVINASSVYDGEALELTAFRNGTIRDLAGNALQADIYQYYPGKTASAAHAYSISYAGLDGAAVSNPTSYTMISPAITLNNPTRPGYTFLGWTGTGLSGTTLNVTIPAGSVGDREYTALWTENNYFLTLIIDGPGTAETVVGPSDLMHCHYGNTYTYRPIPSGSAHLVSVTLDGVPLTEDRGLYSFTMPDHDVTLHVVFNTDYHNVTLGSGGDYIQLNIESLSACLYDETVTISGKPGFLLRSAAVDGAALTVTDGQASFTMPDHDVTVTAQCAAQYLDPTQPENQRTQTVETFTVLTNGSTAWSGTVVACGEINIRSRVTVTDDTYLILADGCALNVPCGVTVGSGASLTICGQSAGSGSLTVATPDSDCAGIGGSAGSEAGNITILSGSVNVTANGWAAGIGGSYNHGSGQIAIHGGSVTAVGNGGAAIGGGNHGAGTVNITGGSVTAVGDAGAAIGGGYSGTGTVNISGGMVNATGGDGAGVGSGDSATGGTVTISGGTVNATANGKGAAIGSGQLGSATVTITGGEVTATANSKGAAIGSGDGGNTTVNISGGTVHATASGEGAAIGGGNGNGTSTVTISGGVITATHSNNIRMAIGDNDGTVILTWDVDAQGAPVPCAITANSYKGSVTLAKDFLGQAAGDIPRLTPCGNNYSAAALNGLTLTPYVPGTFSLTLAAGHGGGALTNSAGSAITQAQTGENVTVTLQPSAGWAPSGVRLSYAGCSVTDTLALTNNAVTFPMPHAATTVTALYAVSYRDPTKPENQQTQTVDTYTELTAGSTIWSGTVVACGEINIRSRVTVTDDTYLILADGCALNVPCGVTVGSGASLTICGQSEGSGILTVATPDSDCAGIGGSAGSEAGNITILGGSVNVTANDWAAGIGGSYHHGSGQIAIHGGSVTAVGNGGAAIGGGNNGAGTVTISGGTVYATGGAGAAIGSGDSATGGTVTISGGTVNATANGRGAGVGSGLDATGGTVTITGGTVEATANSAGAAIGSGGNGSATVTITGGTVTATANDWGAAIGSGHAVYGYVSSCTVLISGGEVTATANNWGAAIGSGDGDGGGATVTISGGTVNATANSSGAAIGSSDGGSATVTLTWDVDAQGAPVPCAITANSYKGSVTLAKDFYGHAADGSVGLIQSGPCYDTQALNGLTLTPDAIRLYSLTLVSEHGTATLTESAAEGETVTVSAVPDAGYVLAWITVEQAGGGSVPFTFATALSGSFVMPQADVTVTCTFVATPAFLSPTFVLPADITAIEEEAFAGIPASVVNIPDGCVSIGDRAFQGCQGLTQIRIPASCALGQDVFDGCGQVFVFGYAGSPAEAYCLQYENCVFIQMTQD